MRETPSAEKDVTSEWLDDALCDALMAARHGKYDGLTVEQHLEHLIERVRDAPPPEHGLVGTGCICGRWKAGLGESITRGFDLHLLDRRCVWCGEPIPTTKRVDAETCSDRCAKDRQRARVTSPATGREARP